MLGGFICQQWLRIQEITEVIRQIAQTTPSWQHREKGARLSQSSIALIFAHNLAYFLKMANDEICAVILAGGKSSRMGFNKALLNVDGQPLIRVLIDRLLPLTSQILISSNDAVSFEFLNLPIIPDYYREQGPLAGLHAAMTRHVRQLYVVIACDLPNLKQSLLRHLISVIEGFDAAIPRSHDGLAHPLCALYRRTCLPQIEDSLQRGANTVIETFLNNSLRIRWVDPGEGRFKDTDLANLNTPEDLHSLQFSMHTKI
jgi:molybdopterin-guanine dinucleotide biosynthesis protein A